MSSHILRLGTRASRLALSQAHHVRELLSVLPGAPRMEIVEISTSRATEAERTLLNVLEGGCQVPVGALAREAGGAGGTLTLRARGASLDGTESLFLEEEGPATDPAELGRRVAEHLLREGAGAILAGIRNAPAD
ncbi:MAG: hypothetical protein WD960_06920 [Gemmatimonadota bacterium]